MSKQLDANIIKTQVRRFRNHPGFRQDEDAADQTLELINAFRQSCTSDAMVVMVADRVMRLTPYFPVPYFVWKAADQFLQEQEETESQRATRMEREYVQSINSPTLAEEDEAFRKEVMKLKERNKVVIRRQEKPNGQFLF